MAFGDPDAPLMVKLFPIGHVLVGLCLTYFTIACFFNTTKLHIGQDSLTIHHSPLPWFGNQEHLLGDIQQLYCTEHYHHSKNGGGHTTYRVNAILSNGRKTKLLSGLTELDQALYIEQEVEHNLGIKDQKVKGEMRS